MNRCHVCLSTCYRPVIARNADGQMQPTGRYQCVKCKFEFTDVANWRTGAPPSPAPLHAAPPPQQEGQASWAA